MSVLDDIFDSAPKRWLKMYLDHADREFCLIWPFYRAQNGYGQFGGDRHIPHRIMCEHRHGPPPTVKHFAAHSCDRGQDGCVNPWHVDWKTPSENQKDRWKTGIHLPRRKLTPEQVDEIRSMKGRERTVDTATRFQVTEANIRQIQAGKIWKLDQKWRRSFTADEVQLIRATPWQVKTANQWAEEFGVTYNIIQKIRAGSTYKWVSPSPEVSDG